MKSLFTWILAIALSVPTWGQASSEHLRISRLTGDLYVFTTWRNYQGTPFPANGLYLVTDKGVALIDSPWDTTQFQPLLDSIRARHHRDVVMCIATHSHADRTAGLEYYRTKGIRTYTTVHTDGISRERKEKRAEFLLSGDTVFTLGQSKFQTFYAGPGHTPDNIVVWFEKDRVLYGGCLVKSTEAADLGNLADADMQAYPATIKKIRRTFGQPAYVIPGHQGWADNRALEHTLELWRQHKTNNRPNNLLSDMTIKNPGGLNWINKPGSFGIEDGVLKVTVEKGTDFFNNPEDNTVTATAPYLFKEIKGNFVATALVRPDFSSQWNAVALMVHLDERNWIKFGFERSDATGKSIVTVVTKTVSDDANGAILEDQDLIWLKLIRKENIYSMLWSTDGKDFKMARLAAMPAAGPVKVGIEAQSPVGDSAVHEIFYFGVEETTVKDLRKGE